MTASDDLKLLCVKECPGSTVKDWKRIYKFSTENDGIIRVFQLKKFNSFITIIEDDWIVKSKLSNKPEDYIFGIGIDDDDEAFAFVQPKYGDRYENTLLLDFALGSAEKYGFFEICESTYEYAPDGKICNNPEILKAKLIELGLEYYPNLDGDDV